MLVQTDLEKAGEFRCSNELFNRIHETTVYTFRTQIPCGVLGGGEPREKEGYGDGGSFLTGMLYNFRSDAFFLKWLQDWRDNQRDDGHFGNTAPAQRPHGGGPSWGGQASELVRRLYLYYGNKAVVAAAYPALKKYVDYLESHTENDILRYFNPFESDPKKFVQWQFLGDWTPPTESADKHKFEFETMEQREFFNNCYRILLWQDLADFADVLGDTAERKRCEARLAVLRPLIHKTYFDAGKNSYRVDRQAYLVIALRARIMPEELRPVILRQLENDIVVTHKGHLDVGLQGSFMLLDLLTKERRPDLAALLMSAGDVSGLGIFCSKNAKSRPGRKRGQDGEARSFWSSALPAPGSTRGWPGIRPDPEQPGFKHFVIRPGIVDAVDWVKCRYRSPYGDIVSNWKRTGGKLELEVSVPPNTTATVAVPITGAATVTESGKDIAAAETIRLLRREAGQTLYELQSGRYVLQSTINP